MNAINAIHQIQIKEGLLMDGVLIDARNVGMYGRTGCKEEIKNILLNARVINLQTVRVLVISHNSVISGIWRSV